MAILGMEGWDQYQNETEIAANWVRGTSALTTTLGRFGGTAWFPNSSTNASTFLRKVLGASYATLGVGYAMLYTDPKTVAGYYLFLESAGVAQICLGLNASNQLEVRRGNQTGPLLGTGTTILVPNVYYHIEFKCFCDDTAGTAEVRLNGVTEINYTGDTKALTANSLDQFTFLVTANTNSRWVLDDIVWWDTSGFINNNFLGDVRVKTLEINGNGSPQQFSLSAGTDQAAVLNDKDADADYIFSSTPGHLSDFNLGDLPAADTVIKAIQVSARLSKDDAGARSVAIGVESGAARSAAVVNPGVGFSWYAAPVVELDPSTGAAWTNAGVNAAGVYVKVEA